ncbi:hypothetical protein PF005_g8772 [Phytophthora fragariae]|uniref:Uncharacterized protein n=1 Tax=Phytophthora fragariae TaxID=53985 RepID=A0A6A3F7N5_9STRA|nr:hypothetical protein PF003_g4063 [Phytophthora fragariae]KAE8941855.1 hypothetical protein PF009_g8365 [Phytophthora fragariae]KAE9015035.1 hypothetical protein PF011_g7793 [Phytophthora fragariae]KAE9118496.1 hypothetical protein PF007_g8904 [Phytophthora fragariae]KAE9118642.1 hypothetical protein PF010_g8134 [Phytophthora fragariae]
MPLPLCTCSCSQHGIPRRSNLSSRSSVQSLSDVETNRNDFCIDSDECKDDDALAVSSPLYLDEYSDQDEVYSEEDTAAIEREEAEAAIANLQLQVRALRKYKTNYELLCGQLGELNAQIGLQLQRHEADVAALQSSIADLQTDKIALEAQVSEAQQALDIQRDAAKQDREYSEHVHRQLGTAADLLKATENRLEQQEQHFAEDMEGLKAQLDDERAEYQETVKRVERELEALRAHESDAREQEALRRRQEKNKHKKELMARAAKLRAVSEELEAQRATVRATKKQLAQVQADNDGLRKQLTNVKRDGAHLTDIIDSQRVEHESHADELVQVKKAKKQLAKRVTGLTREVDQLQSELADAREELVQRNDELETCRIELKGIRTELRQATQGLDNAQKQVEAFQRAENERLTQAKAQERASQERRYRSEFIRMRELLADNQHRASESSKDVQKLRRELLGVQKLLHGCTEDNTPVAKPIDQWAEVMRSSAQMERSGIKGTIMDRVRAFEA